MDLTTAPPRVVAREKRRLKTGPKLYKGAPRLSGFDRVRHKAIKLVIEAERLAAKPTPTADERAWLERLSSVLRAAICDPLPPH